MRDEDIIASFTPIQEGLNSDFEYLLEKRPFLAHYTSIGVVEKIVKDSEIWFSNPLFMNDLQEMRFGMLRGAALFEQSGEVDQASGSLERARRVKQAFQHYFSVFDTQEALDVYVFCLSEHDIKNPDGLLSMWRGYGERGSGAAIVFNTKFITFKPSSPLVFTRVHYDSEANRIAWLEGRLRVWCDILKKSRIPDDKLHLAAHSFFSLTKIFSLISKHKGFEEEREWRIIYLADRDPQKLLMHQFDYALGQRGVEPKLKFKVAPLPIQPIETWTFADIVEQIILGPATSSPLAMMSVRRMLQKIARPEFCERVVPSTIPLRPA